MIFEDRFIYFPEKCGARPLPANVEDVRFTAEDGVELHGWFARGRDPKWTILWFHGNAGNVTHRYDVMLDLVDRLNVNVFLVDYRGYGQSQGSPSEKGLYLDALAAYRTLLARGIPAGRIVIFGKSLGGAVAADLAARVPCAGVILQSTFTSAGEMSKRVIPLFPARWFLRTSYDTLAKMGSIRAPVLVVHGRADEIIPFSMGETLYAAAPGSKSCAWFDDAHHNDLVYHCRQAWLDAIGAFLATLTS